MDTTCPGRMDAVSGTTETSAEREVSSSWIELLKSSVSVVRGKDFFSILVLLEGANADINTDDENSSERSTDAYLIFANILRGKIRMEFSYTVYNSLLVQ
jgi:hypothetical protein